MKRSIAQILVALTLVVGASVIVGALADHKAAYLPLVARIPTPTPIPNVVVQLYLDANRTGERDTAYAIEWDGQWTEFMEPAVAGVRVTMQDESERTYECTSDDGGVCAFAGIPQGRYSLVVRNDVDAAYRYIDPEGEWQEFPASSFMFRSERLGWHDIPAHDIDGVYVPDQHIPLIEEHHIQDPIPVDVSQSTSTIDVAIMMGLLASPLDHTTSQWLWNCVDLDWEVGSVRNYLGDTTGCHGPIDPATLLEERTTGTCDNHQGNDFITFNKSPVYAMANGAVIAANKVGTIVILHDAGVGPCYLSEYHHNSSVLFSLTDNASPEEGERMVGGQLIAYSGDVGGSPRHPHLHASTHAIPREYCDGDILWYLFEVHPRIPYGNGSIEIAHSTWRDLLDPESVSLWTIDNVRVSPLWAELPAAP